MTNLTIAKLDFNSPLHLSKGKTNSLDISEEIIHSDTIKSAMYAIGLQLYDDMNEDFLKQFRVSSAFPYYADELFFPKPITSLPFWVQGYGREEFLKVNKKLKKIQYIGKDFFEMTLNNTGKSTVLQKHEFLQEEQCISRKINNSDTVIYKKSTTQRVRVPKMGEKGDATPFRVEKLFFAKDAGLYFIIDFNEDTTDEFKNRIRGILKLLGESGIGTNRNLGCGWFDFDDFEETTLKLPDVQDDTRWLSLSLYLPKSEDELKEAFTDNKMQYNIIKRGGWLAAPKVEENLSHRKRSVYMFTEGSVFNFPISDKKILDKGRFTDLKPDLWEGKDYAHPVYRDGSCIFLPINM